jgi:parallel beta-helix repeat protein
MLTLLLAGEKLFATNVGGPIGTDTTWTLAGSPYIVTTSIVIAYDATLTIEPGVVIKFNPQLAIIIGSASWGNGNLVARGTTESPIIFTSAKDPFDPCSPAMAGDWGFIYFTDYAVDAVFDANNYVSGCILEHVVVEYAGYGNRAAIFAENSSTFLNYCEVRHNAYYGIQLQNAPPTKITNCEVWDQPQRGIYITNAETGGHLLLHNNIHDNHGGGIYFGNIKPYWFGSSSNIMIGNTISGNMASDGSGIYFHCSRSNILIGNTISSNISSNAGGGVYFTGFYSVGWYGSNGNKLTGNTIQNNTSINGLGAVYFCAGSSNNTLYSNIITDNYIVTGTTGGIYVTEDSKRVSLVGDPKKGMYNIIWGNDGYQVYNNNPFDASGQCDVNAIYVWWGTCDIQQIMAGIFDCLDDLSKAFVVFDPFASLIPGDFDFDKDVDWLDLATFVENWLRQDCAIPDWCEGTDLDLSTNVDFIDFAYFADNWLVGVGP